MILKQNYALLKWNMMAKKDFDKVDLRLFNYSIL